MTKIIIKAFNKLKYTEIRNLAGIGSKTAFFLNDIIDKKKIKSFQDLKTIIKNYNIQNNQKIRYNFLNNDFLLTKNELIYKIVF